MKKAVVLFVIGFFVCSCNKTIKNNSEESEDLGLNANSSVPKDIVITENLITVTDSIFSFRDKKKTLTSIYIWEFDKGFLKVFSFKFYEDESVTYSSRSECDNYGRVIKILTTITNSNDKKIEVCDKYYDKYGNQTQIVVLKSPIINSTADVGTLNYIYQYENEKIIKKTTTTSTHNVIEDIDYTYDTRGNEIQTIRTNDLGELKTKKIYDDSNNLIETIGVNIKDNSIVYQIKYIYKNGLLIKTINGKGENYIEPLERMYKYNENEQLIKESYLSEVIKYSDYDSFGNWTKKEHYSNNYLQEVSFRTIVYK